MLQISCKRSSKKNNVSVDNVHTIDTIFYKNGLVECIKSVIKDSILDGRYLEFYDNGNKKYDILYKNGKRYGLETTFFRNGNRRSKGSFIEDKPNGYVFWYYESGKLNYRTFWYNGTQIYDAYFYYPDGKIEAYNFKDFFGNTIYAMAYDKNGKITHDKGLSISSEYIINPKTYKVNDSITVELCIPEPPGYSAKVFIAEYQSTIHLKEIDYPYIV